MMNININELNPDELEKKLIDNEKEIARFKDQYEKVLFTQSQLFEKWVKKLYPVIRFIKNKHYRFFHPNGKIHYLSARGPILGYDNNEAILFVYDIDEPGIVGVHINNEDKKTRLSAERFFKDYDFETAMDGLLAVLTHQQSVVQDYQSGIDTREAAIEKYNLD